MSACAQHAKPGRRAQGGAGRRSASGLSIGRAPGILASLGSRGRNRARLAARAIAPYRCQGDSGGSSNGEDFRISSSSGEEHRLHLDRVRRGAGLTHYVLVDGGPLGLRRVSARTSRRFPREARGVEFCSYTHRRRPHRRRRQAAAPSRARPQIRRIWFMAGRSSSARSRAVPWPRREAASAVPSAAERSISRCCARTACNGRFQDMPRCSDDGELPRGACREASSPRCSRRRRPSSVPLRTTWLKTFAALGGRPGTRRSSASGLRTRAFATAVRCLAPPGGIDDLADADRSTPRWRTPRASRSSPSTRDAARVPRGCACTPSSRRTHGARAARPPCDATVRFRIMARRQDP